jgi:carbon storage regulator
VLARGEENTMLVLSRKKDESIIINDNIVVTVVEIRGDKVRLGFDAPKEVPIHRREVYDAIKRSEAENDVRPGADS